MLHASSRTDTHHLLDLAKVADVVVFVMSCAGANVAGLKKDPDAHANAIDEVGYRNLQLLRKQGVPSMLGLL